MSYVFEPKIASIAIAGGSDRFPVRRIYCVGRNYAAHAREMGFDPDRDPPFFFSKPADAVVEAPPGKTTEVAYPPKTTDYHHEIELVAAIGKAGRDIPVERANEHVFGYAVGLDMTRRDLQIALRDKGRPWDVAKGFDQSAPIGPLHRADSIGHPVKGAVWVQVNGTDRQRGDIAQMIWSVPEVVANLSTYFELRPGDLVFTGTPDGVGAVKRGDTLVGGVDGLGELRIAVV